MGADFSWTRATFAGFGVLRREPRGVLLWALVGLVFAFVDQILDVRTEVLGATGHSGTWVIPMLSLARGVIAMVAMAIFSAAVYRAVLRPEGEARGRMRFGVDEIRLTLIWLLQGVALLVLMVIAIVPVFAVSPKLNDLVMETLGGLAVLVGLIAWLVLVVRLALAAPMALAEGRWTMPAAWRLTRRHAWKIAGVYIPLVIALAGVFVVWNTLYALVAYVVVPGFSPHQLRADDALADLFRPVRLVFTLLSVWLGAAAAAVFHAPVAAIYRDLKGVDPDGQAAVFD
jgi:hypothetical protein